ncbi:hypothetical protein TNCV_1644201 [Trichonephila clavipes]|nr:hypothetical protein TNCV_1644201 [Trichonephila clavipes]
MLEKSSKIDVQIDYIRASRGSPMPDIIFKIASNSRIQLITFLKFRIEVVEELFYNCDDRASGQSNPGRPTTVDNPARLSEPHFISHIFLLLLQTEAYKTVQSLLFKKMEVEKILGRKHDSGVIIAEEVGYQPLRARAYCAHPSLRDHWALRCMSRCPDQVVSLKQALVKSPSKLGTHLSNYCSRDERLNS